MTVFMRENAIHPLVLFNTWIMKVEHVYLG